MAEAVRLGRCLNECGSVLQAYFDYLDHTGGFFYERWGDAPVHSLAAVMLLNATEVHTERLQHMMIQCSASLQHRAD